FEVGGNEVDDLSHAVPSGGSVSATGPLTTGASDMAGSWLRRKVRMCSATIRISSRPSASSWPARIVSRCRSLSEAEFSTGRASAIEAGGSATWIGLIPCGTSAKLASLAQSTIRWPPLQLPDYLLDRLLHPGV